MTLALLADDRGGFRLFRGGEPIGWLRDRWLGRQAFEDEADAVRAARVALGALSRWLVRQRRGEVMPGWRRALSIRRDDADTLLTLGGTTVGRLIPPGDPMVGREPRWGFELLLPPGLGTALELSAARVIDAALARRAAALRLAAAPAG